MRGYAHVIKEDPLEPQLLFLGTEFGLWISVDGGAHWAQFKGGDIPPVAVRDLAVQPRDNDLVLATHGRGIWIVDDITPLRHLTPRAAGAGGRLRVRATGAAAHRGARAAGPTAPPPSSATIPRPAPSSPTTSAPGTCSAS